MSFLSPDSPLASIMGAVAAPTAVTTAHVPATGPVDFTGLALTLLDYQETGVRYALANRRVYFGDEMGLGKTFQAIAAVVLDKAFPAVVICPPSLTRNWAREIERLAPGTRVVTLATRKAAMPAPADVYIIGDAVLSAWVGVEKNSNGRGHHAAGVLSKMGLQAMVIDEAHRFKNYKAKRTIAASLLARTLPASAMVILMSGTAVVNRPDELAPQLGIAGRLNMFGGLNGYLARYAPVVDRWGTRGSDNLAELHDKMTSAFYLRRLRSDVLTLPGKGRQSVATELRGQAARDYVRATDDIIAYVRSERGDKAATAAGKAEALVMLNTLRRLVGTAKIPAVIEYVQDLVDAGESVFVAAWHTDVVRAIADHFGAVTIMGGDSVDAKDASVQAFQSGASKVLVGNIVAAGVGFTLTAAAHVVIAELPWTGADLSQVEDRLDRIGQTRKVVSHVMLGANGAPTVDERVLAIIERKAAVTGMVLDGKAGAVFEDDSITQQLLDSYR